MAKVLIVDDSAAISQILQRYLARHGYEAVTAPDGEAALEILQRGDLPDLVMADVTMPRLGGAQLLRRMRDNVGLRNIPVVLMSGADREEYAMRAYGDYQAWLPKPFDLPQVLDMVQRVLAARG
jgi:two-component system cell cycle sensor histidine kinase/response regulator CckA